jgi:Fur family peroxide stress response transcriptional regulator
MSKENYKIFLKGYGLKATPGRIRLLKYLADSKKPNSIKDIGKAIGTRTMDQVTIYRTLETFKTLGFVRRVDFHKDYAYYELAGKDHHHIFCENCGRIEDFEGCGSDKLIKTALRQSKQFASINDHSIELFGVCRSCARSLK